MKCIYVMLALALACSNAHAKGKIQNEDVKSLTEILSAGGASSQLINDTKVYVTANGLNVQLSTAIAGGLISGIQESFLLANVGLEASVASNALTIALKQKNGTSDPSVGGSSSIAFRSVTATSGAFVNRTITGALSVVVPASTTIGTISATQSYIYVYALDNAGTVELAVSLSQFSTDSLASTTSISGGSSASTLYSTSARTNVPIRLIGRISVTEATAGTWASGPTEVALPTVITQGPGSVTSTTTGSERIERIRFGGPVVISACTTNPCTIYDQSGSWMSSVSRVGAGQYNLNINAGIFSAMPTCSCLSDSNSAAVSCQTTYTGGHTATSIGLQTNNSIDTPIHVICMGPR